MSEFSFSDINKVHWLATLKISLARGFCSGIVFGLIALSQGNFGIALLFPIGLALFGLPYSLFMYFCGWIAGSFIPLLGLFFRLIGSAMVCVGDPIVYLVNRQWPHLLNIADFQFFTLRPMIFITHPM